MKKILILMLLCGMASAEVILPPVCTIILNTPAEASQMKNCNDLKENCIAYLDEMIKIETRNERNHDENGYVRARHDIYIFNCQNNQKETK